MSTVSAGRILSFESARHLVEQYAATVSPGGLEELELLDALGRVLGESIRADRDFPPFARATRDGYAVRAADVSEVPVRLAVAGEIKAGQWPDPGTNSIGHGKAVGIMTGAPLPAGADAVVMVEHTALLQDGAVEIRRAVRSGENFVPRGAEAPAGEVLLDRGRRLDQAGIAIAASVGKSRVQVFRKPRVAVLSTGDEVVEIDATPEPAQIRNSNSYSLAAQVQNAGGEAMRLPIAPDQAQELRSLIEQGLDCDLLLITGGVSMGRYDLVEQVLAELNARVHFTGVEIQPGRPLVFGSCVASGDRPAKERYFFGLPGNPLSTMMTFELFARPMIEALAGMAAQRLIFLRARLKAEVRVKTGLRRFLPAILSGEFEKAEVELVRWQGSGDIAALGRSNCYLVIPPDRERVEIGEYVSVLMP